MEKFLIREDNGFNTYIDVYLPKNKISDKAIVIFPGGGYCQRAEHEGKGYADFLSDNGFTSFVVNYSTTSEGDFHFPKQLLDARSAVRFVRANSEKFGIDKNQIYVMGSSAGGHLTALTSTCFEKIEGEESDPNYREDFIPNGQILCYPVIELYGKNANVHSAKNLFGENYSEELCIKYSPNLLVSEKTPKAFIWHTFEDDGVVVQNSLNYAIKLKENGVSCEMHLFPHGGHGKGLATKDTIEDKYVSTWSSLLLKWLKTY